MPPLLSHSIFQERGGPRAPILIDRVERIGKYITGEGGSSTGERFSGTWLPDVVFFRLPFEGDSMERKIRRTDRAIPESEAKGILEKGEFGILSTASLDGQPYGVPISYSYTGNVIYFHSAIEGHKLENLGENNRVSFCVVGKTGVLPEKFATRYESAIVFGKAFELTDHEKHNGLLEIVKKYSPGFINEGLQYIENAVHKTRVYKIVIESISGKSRK